MSLLTGKNVDECVDILHRFQPRVKGVKNSVMLRALEHCGLRCDPLRAPQMRPTVAAAIRALQGRPADQPYLLNITGHYIVLKGRKIYDNFHPTGIFIREYPHRRTRVKRMWEVVPQFGTTPKVQRKAPSPTIRYEWVIETLDQHGDITNVDHSDTFPGMPSPGKAVALVRDSTSRTWAYVRDGKLPETFENGTRVPKRFLAVVKP